FLNNLDNNTTSGILAPAPPIINATTVPSDIPLDTKASAIGSIVSGLIYIGIPITEAITTEIIQSPLAYIVINASGMNPYIKAPIDTPINREGNIGYKNAHASFNACLKRDPDLLAKKPSPLTLTPL